MSDQSPETALDNSEPSMEDILASIREIIAVDDENQNADTLLHDDEPPGGIGDVSDLMAPVVSKPDLETHNVLDIGFGTDSSAVLEQTMDALKADQHFEDTLNVDNGDFDLMTELSDMGALEFPEPAPETGDVLTDAGYTGGAGLILAANEGPRSSHLGSKQAQTAELVARELDMAEVEHIRGEPIKVEHIRVEPIKVEPIKVEPVASQNEPSIDFDIEDELAALLDEDLASESLKDADDEMQSTGLTSDKLAAAGPDLPPIDVPVDDSFDLDISMLIDDISQMDIADTDAVSIDVIGAAKKGKIIGGDKIVNEFLADSSHETDDLTEIQTAVSDLELQALFEDIDARDITETVVDAPVLPASLGDDDVSEQDADLELVKSLMADLVDTNVTLDDHMPGFEPPLAMASAAAAVGDGLKFTDADGADDSHLHILNDILNSTADDAVAIHGYDDNDDLAFRAVEVLDADDLGLDTPELGEIRPQNAQRLEVQTSSLETFDAVAALEAENIDHNLDLQIDPADYDDYDGLSKNEPDLAAVGDEEIVSSQTTETQALSLASIAQAARADAQAIREVPSKPVSSFKIGAAKAAADAVLTEGTAELVSSASSNLGEEPSRLVSHPNDDVERVLAKLLDRKTLSRPHEDGDDSGSEYQSDNRDNDEESVQNDKTVHEIEIDFDENLEITSPEMQTASNELEIIKENSDMAGAAASNVDIIMDDVTEEATSSVFAQLSQVVEEKAIVAERGDRIGDLVMEALRPMLKDWLDANLKGIVERAVTKEVKRISTGK